MRYPYIILSIVALLIVSAPRVNAATNGSLIKTSTDSAVYYLLDGKRYAFPNERVFFSWHGDFRSVLTVSPNELASYVLTGNVTYRPGRWLVKVQTDSKVYAVSRYGILRWVKTPTIAAALYGPSWPTRVQDVADTFFINYTIGTPIERAQDYSPMTELAITQIAQNISGATVPAILNPLDVMEHNVDILINQHRQSKGIPMLVWNDTVANVARGHSEDMATGKVPFSHDGFADRMAELRKTIKFSYIAENVASSKGYDDPATTAVEGWLDSPGHLTNLENPAYTQTGVGAAVSSNGTYYFTQIFIQAPN